MINQLIKEADDFSDMLEKRGYDLCYTTKESVVDTVKNNMSRYLYLSLMGKENGLKNHFYLRAFLKNNSDSKELLEADFTLAYSNQNFVAKNIIFNLRDKDYKVINSITYDIRGSHTIPTVQEALAKIYAMKEQNAIPAKEQIIQILHPEKQNVIKRKKGLKF